MNPISHIADSLREEARRMRTGQGRGPMHIEATASLLDDLVAMQNKKAADLQCQVRSVIDAIGTFSGGDGKRGQQ